MSVLETPRLYFGGQISWDPITTNNDPKNYDENDGETILSSTVAQFRAQAIDQVVTAGNWNPHGTHRSSFFGTTVTGFDAGAGRQVADPVVGSAVALTGMLVDVDPYGGNSSQLFFDSFQLGVAGGYRIAGPGSARFVARYINFGRNPTFGIIAGGASVTWQTSFAKDGGLVVDPFDSAALQALAEALEPDDVLGLTVRFHAYRTVYFDDDTLRRRDQATPAAEQALQDKLVAGGFQPNPTRSTLVGVVGLWRRGEPAQEPGDRALLPPASGQVMAAVHARVTGTDLVLDLGNSVPETGADLTKRNLGPIDVVATDGDGTNATTIGTLAYADYDRDAYNATAGIVTVPLTGPADRDLHLRKPNGSPLLDEAPLRAIALTPCRYLDEGTRATVGFQVYVRGEIAPKGITAGLFQLDTNGAVLGQVGVATDQQGRIPLTIPAAAGSIIVVVPVFTGDRAPAGGPDTQFDTYMHVRVLPADSAVAALPPTWQNVYARVLSNWNAMAPCMDNWLRLDDPDQVRALAVVIKKLTDPSAFESYRFMPVTRDMSAGERTLLHAFLDGPAGGPTPAGPAPDVTAAPAPAAQPSATPTERSRSLRNR